MSEMDIDRAIIVLFREHPFVNVIRWEYFLSSNRNDEAVTEALRGPTDALKRLAQDRFIDPSQAPSVFWDTYRRWCLPSFEQVNQWRTDILQHCVTILKVLSVEDTQLFTNQQPIIDAMGVEYPEQKSSFQAAFSKAGLEGAKNVYEMQMNHGSQKGVCQVTRYNPIRFSVVEVCIRLMREVLTKTKEFNVSRKLFDSASTNKHVQTEYLKQWPFICSPIDVSRLTLDKLDLRSIHNLWNQPRLLQLIDDEHLASERQTVQNIFAFSHTDPTIGLDVAIERVNNRFAEGSNKQLTGYDQLTRGFTFEKNPWSRQKSTWSGQAPMSRRNYGIVDAIIQSVELQQAPLGFFEQPLESVKRQQPEPTIERVTNLSGWRVNPELGQVRDQYGGAVDPDLGWTVYGDASPAWEVNLGKDWIDPQENSNMWLAMGVAVGAFALYYVA